MFASMIITSCSIGTSELSGHIRLANAIWFYQCAVSNRCGLLVLSVQYVVMVMK